MKPKPVEVWLPVIGRWEGLDTKAPIYLGPEPASVYTEVIQPAAAEKDVDAFNAGEISEVGMILEQIALAIRDSALVIADITPPNQNVYYELGYAHAIGKPTILMARKGTELPFDVRSYRVLFYEDSESGLQEAREKLAGRLEEIVGKISDEQASEA